MIHTTLNRLKVYLTEQMKTMFSDGECTVTLSALNKDGAQSNGDIFITLVHIEEETSAKQQSTYQYHEENEGKRTPAKKFANPELHLNLYILISAQHENYETALHHISGVIRAFQSENVFKVGEEKEPSLIVNLYPLKMEQNINLWQSIGSKMMPSVLYKVRMVSVQSSASEDTDLIRQGEIRYPYIENGVEKKEITILSKNSNN